MLFDDISFCCFAYVAGLFVRMFECLFIVVSLLLGLLCLYCVKVFNSVTFVLVCCMYY